MKHEAAFNEAIAAVSRPGMTKARAARMLFDAGVAAERERCAKVCEKVNVTYGDYFAEQIRKGETP